VIFQSDDGGQRSAKFTGEVDMSKGTIPPDNSPYRDGKGMFYEGGTRVVALANWPGRIKRGTVVDEPIHTVDMYPTIANLAGASMAKTKPLDGLDVWQTISEGKTSPRHEVVYGIEPFRAAISQGNWKLVWQAMLPSRLELFDLAQDPAEQTNVAHQNPGKVAELQQRIEILAGEATQPLLLQEALRAAWSELTDTVALPGEEAALEMEP